jgi:hypothetical protein
MGERLENWIAHLHLRQMRGASYAGRHLAAKTCHETGRLHDSISLTCPVMPVLELLTAPALVDEVLPRSRILRSAIAENRIR